MDIRVGGNFQFLVVFFLSFSFWIALPGCATPSSKKSNEMSRTDRARMLIEVANGALAEGDPTGALQNLTEAERIDNSLPELYHSFAVAYLNKHNLPLAIENAQKAVAIKPDYPEANNTLGKLLIDAGHFSEAVAPLEKAANNALYRDAYRAWTDLGIIQYRLGQFDQAESFMSRAIQDAPTAACVAYYYRGEIKVRKMQFTDAIQDYDQATKKLCARFGEAYLAMGIAYEQSKQYDLARKTFLEVEKRYPNTKLAEQAIGRIRYLP